MYDAYISYRRSSGIEFVILLNKALCERGLNCFCDIEYIRAGKFPEDLKSKIEDSEYFLLILTPNCLDRCNDEGDWVYQEIITALEKKISIIPIICEGFVWPNELPRKIKDIVYYESAVLNLQYFNAFLDELVNVNMGSRFMVNDTKNKRDVPNGNFVFISYSTKDQIISDQTKQILETNGISCWMAPQSIPAGSDYGEEIPKAIDKCKAFLLLLSRASQESNWVPKEVGQAIGKGKIVIPFQIDNADISNSFDFYLTNSQRISAYNRMAEAYQELVKRLLSVCASRSDTNAPEEEHTLAVTAVEPDVTITDHWEQYKLGFAYEFGQGRPQDYKLAVKWYLLSADQENSWAQNRLGDCYYAGHGVEQSYEIAAQWYARGAQNEDNTAQYNLGLCYYHGRGVVFSYAKAFAWFCKSANLGLPVAQYQLGMCYFYGKGTKRDYPQAFYWLKQAAEQGIKAAYPLLAECYEKGLGTATDPALATHWKGQT